MAFDFLAFVAPIVSSFLGKDDAPSAPTAQQMKTDLQIQLDPMLAELAKDLNMDYKSLKSQFQTYLSDEIDKRTNFTPSDYIKAAKDAKIAAGSTDKNYTTQVNKLFSTTSDEERAAISKYAKEYSQLSGAEQQKLLTANNNNPSGTTARSKYIMDKMAADKTLSSGAQEFLKSTQSYGLNDKGIVNGSNINYYDLNGSLGTFKKYNQIAGNLKNQGYDVADIEKEYVDKNKVGDNPATGLLYADTNDESLPTWKYSKEITKPGTQTTPYPQIIETDEEKLVKTNLKKIMDEDPTKTIDEAIGILKQAADPTKQKEYMTALEKTANELKNNPYVKKIEAAGGPTAQQTAIRNVVTKRMYDAVSNNGADYRANLYKAASDPLIAKAEEDQAKNAANIATRMGNSQTIVDNTNSGIRRDLDRNLGTIGARSAADAEALITDIISGAGNFENSLAGQQLQATTAAGALQQQGTDQSAQAFNNLVNLSNNTAATQTNAANSIIGANNNKLTANMTILEALNNLAKQNENKQLTNMNLKNAYETDKKNELQNIINNILSIYDSQRGPQQVQANALTNAFNVETANAKDKQALISDTLATALNANKPEPVMATTTPYTPTATTIPNVTLPTPSVISTYNNSKNYSYTKNIPT